MKNTTVWKGRKKKILISLSKKITLEENRYYDYINIYVTQRTENTQYYMALIAKKKLFRFILIRGKEPSSGVKTMRIR